MRFLLREQANIGKAIEICLNAVLTYNIVEFLYLGVHVKNKEQYDNKLNYHYYLVISNPFHFPSPLEVLFPYL